MLESLRSHSSVAVQQVLPQLQADLVRNEADHSHRLANPPVFKLPTDLLAYVVELGSLDDPGIAVRMSHVCARWRLALLTTPRAWSRLRIGPLKSLARVKAWLHRSAGKLDELVINGTSSSYFTKSLVKLLQPTICSLHRLHVSDIDTSVLAAWQYQCRQLVELSLVRVGTVSQIDSGFLAPESACLRILTIQSVTLRPSDVSGFWNAEQMRHLTSLSLNAITLESSEYNPFHPRHFLPNTPSLRFLDMNNVVVYSTRSSRQATLSLTDPAAARQPVVMQKLAHLGHSRHTEIKHSSSERSMVHFPFNDIYCPALLHARLDSCTPLSHPGKSGSTFELSGFLSGLQVLDLSACAAADSLLLNGLTPYLDDLQFLNVSHTQVGSEFLEFISQEASPSDDPPLSKLRALSMVACDISGGAIIRLVRFRMHGRTIAADGDANPLRVRKKPKLAALSALANERKAAHRPAPVCGRSSRTVAALDWLCLDGNQKIDAQAVEWLRASVRFVSCNWENVNPVRTAGRGRWQWNA